MSDDSTPGDGSFCATFSALLMAEMGLTVSAFGFLYTDSAKEGEYLDRCDLHQGSLLSDDGGIETTRQTYSERGKKGRGISFTLLELLNLVIISLDKIKCER